MRPEKKAISEEVQQQLGESAFVLLTNYAGMSVDLMADLRGRLREADGQMMVVRNAVLSFAAKELGWNGFSDLMDGPTAMIVGQGDVARIAKLVNDFAKEHEVPVIRGGRFGRQVLSGEEVVEMAILPAREVLLGLAVGTIAAPMSGIVGVLQQKVLTLLYALKAIEEKKSAA